MTDYRAMYDREHIGAWDLEGRDVVVTIDRVIPGEIVGNGGRKDKKPILHFIGAKKTMIVNRTNGKTIATLYGPKVEEWKGKRITLYSAMTRALDGSGDVECIRVRPKIPSKPSKEAFTETNEPQPPPAPEFTPEREPGSDG